MREFEDRSGRRWVATLSEAPGIDYKGRFHLVLAPVDGGDAVELTDVRWNARPTAARTLATMSVAELRRRLRSARGRGGLRGTLAGG